MTAKFTKRPSEVFRQTVDVSKAIPGGSAITSCAVSASRADGTDATDEVLGSTTGDVDGCAVKCLVKGGVPGTSYKLTLSVGVNTGERLEEDVEMLVEGPVEKSESRGIADILLGGIAEYNANPEAADEAYLERSMRIKPVGGKPPPLPELSRDGSLKERKK